MSTQANMNDASNAYSEPPKQTALDSDSMDVDEVPTTTTNLYKVIMVPGKPNLIGGLDLPEDFEEPEAEMSSDEDDDDEDVDELEEGKSAEVSAAILLDKSIDETDDADDGDYVPPE